MTKKNEVVTRKAPELRFPDFRGLKEWETNALNNIAHPIKNRGHTENSKNILILSSEHGIVGQGEYFDKKIASENADRYISIKLNDFVYNDRTTKLFVYGAIKRLFRHEAGLVSPIYKCFRFNSDQNPIFWEWYFESSSHEGQLKSLINEGARTGRYNISIDGFLSMPVLSPSQKEQQKIADCLISINDLITVQVQKIETLKAHKKSLMHQLFPVEGETVPCMRFPEFREAGQWEESTLQGVATIRSGSTPARSNAKFYVDGSIPWVKTTDLAPEKRIPC